MQVTVSNAAPAVAFDRPNTINDRLGTLMTAFAHNGNNTGVFESSVDPIIVGQAAYNSAYGTNFVSSGWCNSPTNPTAKCDGFARIQEGSQPGQMLGFNTLAAPNVRMQIPFQPKGMHDEANSASFDDWGRMTANLGLEAPGATPLLQNIILFPFVNPVTEIFDTAGMPSSLHVTPIMTSTDGTQIWKITHNGEDTHPIHFHLFNVQVLNRVTWDNIIIPTDPTELGWKDTVRISPLEDTIVAMRPIVPSLPFGIPDSSRPLNPMMPIGARGDPNTAIGNEAGFNNTDTNGTPITPIVNAIVNFGWEYVWHCHILSHEEMDMMRPMSVKVTSVVPPAPTLSLLSTAGSTTTAPQVVLQWTDPTPASITTTLGNPRNEIGFRIERAMGITPTFAAVGTALANQTIYTDTSVGSGIAYRYHVVAFNVAGGAISNIQTVTTSAGLRPLAPTALGATSQTGPGVLLSWFDNATNETGFSIERALASGAFAQVAAPGQRAGTGNTTYTDNSVTVAATYSYRVRAVRGAVSSAYSNVATVVVLPNAPTNLQVPSAAATRTTLTLVWKRNQLAPAALGYEIWRGSNATTWTRVTTVGDVANYTDTGLTPNTRYYYRVRAFSLGMYPFSIVYSTYTTPVVNQLTLP